MVAAEFQYAEDYLAEALRRYRRMYRVRIVAKQILILIGLTATLALAIMELFTGRVGSIVFFMPVLFLIHPALGWMENWRVKQLLRNSPCWGEYVRIEFLEEGIREKTGKSDARLDWSVLTRVAHFADGFLLFEGPQFFHWVPLRSLVAPSSGGEFHELLLRKVAEHEIIEEITGANTGLHHGPVPAAEE